MLKSHLCLALAALNVFTALAQFSTDPCDPKNHKEINDPQRSTGYALSTGQTPLCDINLSEGWYRFNGGAGSEMPTECPGNHKCGTIVSLWMKGTHPKVEDGIVQRQVCGDFTERVPGCCDSTIGISVKNCGGFYVYYLSPPTGCSAAYCAGDKAPCPFGQYSLTGFAPCRDAFPKLSTPPTLTGPNVRGKTFDFVCKINYPKQDPNQAFEVSWYFNGRENPAAPSQELSDPIREVTLDGSALNNFFNTDIGCAVRSFYKDIKEVKSPAYNSTSYFAGIKISPPKLVISEQDSLKTVSLTSTVPIVCTHNFQCCLNYILDVDATNQMSVRTDCQYSLCSTDWNSNSKSATLTVQVAAKQDMENDGDKQMLLTFESLLPAGGGKYLDIFLNHQDQITVDAQDVHTSTCCITGDPHITAFDYRNTYHLYNIGDYIAYEVRSRHFQLQFRTWRCWKVTCVCGVVIQEGNDIIRIDQCSQRQNGPHTSPIIQTARKLGPGTVIQRSPTEIGVYLSSGTEVKIQPYKTHLNVFLTTPGSDRGRGRGLCGTNDGRSDNDFTHPNGQTDDPKKVCPSQNCQPKSFMSSWSVTGAKSLFTHIPDAIPEDEEFRYCTCKKKDRKDPIIDCSLRGNTPTTGTACTKNCKTITDNVGIILPRPVKRSAEYVDEDSPDDEYSSEEVPEIDTDMPWTEAAITESEANKLCTDAVEKSPLYNMCKSQTQMIEMTKADCMADVLHGGTTEMVEDVTQAFTAFCQFTMAKDPANYMDNDKGERVMMPAYLEMVCDMACEKHGRCTDEGGCQCNKGWEGPLCQIQSGKGPQLDRIRSGPLCDRGSRPCQKIFMDVSNIVVDSELKCRTKTVTVGGTYTGDPHSAEAEFLSLNRIACALPETDVSVQHYNISAGNEGGQFGNELQLMVFDSTCMDCNDERCTPKTIACHINNVCYNDGAQHKTDSNKVCDVSKSLTEWTVRGKTGNHANQIKPAHLLIAILGALSRL